jgi:putative endonuclease
MSNVSKTLYVGVTNDLEKRVLQHKSKLIPGYTRKYNLFKLVDFESFRDIRDAIRREKQIKGWLRSKKVALIQSVNLQWDDLAEEHFRNGTRVNPEISRGIRTKRQVGVEKGRFLATGEECGLRPHLLVAGAIQPLFLTIHRILLASVPCAVQTIGVARLTDALRCVVR